MAATLATGDNAGGSSGSSIGTGLTDEGCVDSQDCLGGSETRLVPHRTANAPSLHTASAAAGAPLLHAGAIFNSLEGFRQAVKHDQDRFKTNAVVHKGIFQQSSGAFICHETHEAIQEEGIASTKEGNGALDRQWWRLVCAGACGFVAEARLATGKKLNTTALKTAMREHVLNNPLVAAVCEVGVNGVRQGQWVVTLYKPHTCAGTAAPAGATLAAPAAAAAGVATLTAPAASALVAIPATPAAPGGAGYDAAGDTLAAPAAAVPNGCQGGSVVTSVSHAVPADKQLGCALVQASDASGASAEVRCPFLKLALPAGSCCRA
jgi:hypothetical protein